MERLNLKNSLIRNSLWLLFVPALAWAGVTHDSLQLGPLSGGSAPVSTAIFEADSTTQGVLPPRMTSTQRLAIVSPAAGLMVYDTTTNLLSVYNGSIWVDANNASTTSAFFVSNLGIKYSVAANAITISLTQSDGSSTPTSGVGTVSASFRSPTATTGGYTVFNQTTALSITIPSTSTIGHTSAVNQYVWVYLLNDAGTNDICVSGVTVFLDTTLNAATQIAASGAGSSTGSVLYCSATHSGSLPTRLIGRFLVNEATAGTWASAPSSSEVSPRPQYASTDWVQYTPTLSAGFGTTTNVKVFSRRVGDSLELQGSWTTGTVAASAATMTIGYNGANGGVSVDASKMGTVNNTVGSAAFVAGNVVTGVIWTGNGAAVGFSNLSGSSTQLVTANVTAISLSTVGAAFYAKVPIAGWSAFGPL